MSRLWAVMVLVAGAALGQDFHFIEFIETAALEANLPTCAAGSVYETKSIFVQGPGTGSWYHCPSGGAASWDCIAGNDCAGTGDITAVGECLTGSCFQSETARFVFIAPSVGGVAAFRALTEADVSDLSHTTDTSASVDCAGTLTYLDGEANCDTYTLSGDTTALVTTTGTVDAGDAGVSTTKPAGAVIRVLSSDAGCTAITDGVAREFCYQEDTDTLYICEPSAGGCDTAGEWIQIGGGGAAISLDFDSDGNPEVLPDASNLINYDILSDGVVEAFWTTSHRGTNDVNLVLVDPDSNILNRTYLTNNLDQTELYSDNGGLHLNSDGPTILETQGRSHIYAHPGGSNQLRILTHVGHDFALASFFSMVHDGTDGVIDTFPSGDGVMKIQGCRINGPLSTAPVVVTECDTYWDTDLNLLCFYNGTNWLQADDWSTVCT